MTEEELTRLEALANAATEGPWAAIENNEGWFVKTDESDPWCISEMSMFCDEDKDGRKNAKFIAASRQAVPDLIAEVRRLREFLQIIHDTCDEEIKARYRCHNMSEVECAGKSKLYRFLSVPRNLARAALKQDGGV